MGLHDIGPRDSYQSSKMPRAEIELGKLGKLAAIGTAFIAAFKASILGTGNMIYTCPSTITESLTIPDNSNALSFGPVILVKKGIKVKVGKKSTWTIK